MAERVMKELYVIVKEEDVRIVAEGPIGGFSRKAKKVLEDIARIKDSSAYLAVDEDSFRLHPAMPLPSDELRVWVCGGFTHGTCALQLYSLRKAGYDAYYHSTACLDFLGRLVDPKQLPNFRELVPEYYAN